MSILRNHIVLMFLYALGASSFFSLLWKSDRTERVQFFLLVFAALFAGALLAGWLMYPFPLNR